MGDRKYSQRGYRDDGERRRQRAPQGPRPEKDGPRGRGLGAPTEWRFLCARCGHAAPGSPGGPGSPGSKIAADAACGHCGNDLHTCTNCRHFDTGARFECGVQIAARVSPKDRANRCDLFEPKRAQGFASDSDTPDDPKAAFDSLFDF